MMYYFAKLIMVLFYKHSQDFRAGVVYYQYKREKGSDDAHLS